MKKFILFDLDGTITDSEEGIIKSARYALEAFGVSVEDDAELRRFIGPPIRKSFKEYYGFNSEEIERIVAKYRERYNVTGVYENRVYEGMPALFERLKGLDKTLLIATSKPIDLAREVARHFGLAKYFKCICGAEPDGARSEKAEVIEYALRMGGIDRLDECIMVGDREHDVIGARANAIESIGVLYGYGSREELTNAGADYLAPSVGELTELLCRL